jgi:hypothetical protein
VASAPPAIPQPIESVPAYQGDFALFVVASLPSRHLLDIVLLHGLAPGFSAPQRAFEKAFRPSSRKPGFPKLLAAHFPTASILSVKWDSRSFGSKELHELEDEVCQALLAGNVGTKPYIMIGHSMGGIMIKGVLKRAEEAASNPNYRCLLAYLVGVVTCGTPHLGSPLAGCMPFKSPLLRRLRLLDTESWALAKWFEERGRGAPSSTQPTHAELLKGLPCLAIAEEGDMSLGQLLDCFCPCFRPRVVPVECAHPLGGNWELKTAEGTDHKTVAKPDSVRHPTWVGAYDSLQLWLQIQRCAAPSCQTALVLAPAPKI